VLRWASASRVRDARCRIRRGRRRSLIFRQPLDYRAPRVRPRPPHQHGGHAGSGLQPDQLPHRGRCPGPIDLRPPGRCCVVVAVSDGTSEAAGKRQQKLHRAATQAQVRSHRPHRGFALTTRCGVPGHCSGYAAHESLHEPWHRHPSRRLLRTYLAARRQCGWWCRKEAAHLR
jgi:hypothetical protein